MAVMGLPLGTSYHAIWPDPNGAVSGRPQAYLRRARGDRLKLIFGKDGQPHRRPSVEAASPLATAAKKVDRFGVEAPQKQGANSMEYSLYFEDSQRCCPGWIGVEATELFLSGP
jgi:hypothetical protein